MIQESHVLAHVARGKWRHKNCTNYVLFISKTVAGRQLGGDDYVLIGLSHSKWTVKTQEDPERGHCHTKILIQGTMNSTLY